jgi:hypothetical protein
MHFMILLFIFNQTMLDLSKSFQKDMKFQSLIVEKNKI